MDVLSEFLHNAMNLPDFRLHKNADQIGMNHLCFADDLLMFCHGDAACISVLMQTLY